MNIRDTKQWLVWKEKNRPISALTGQSKGWNKNLSTLAEAEQFCVDNPGYKLGFCFSADTPFYGLDLDSCVTERGILTDWALKVCQMFPRPEQDPLYGFNISVSGTGIKLIFEYDGQLNHAVQMMEYGAEGAHDPQIELFTSNKYFALTCDRFNLDVVRLESIDELQTMFDRTLEHTPTEPRSAPTTTQTDPDELRSYLSKLDIEDYDARADWIRIMAACHHATQGSDEGYEAFKEWSAGDESKFNESHCRRDWDSLRSDVQNPITIASLIKELPSVEPEMDFAPVETGEASTVYPWLLNSCHRNHAKAADQFASEHSKVLRYISEWGKWAMYDGCQWQIVNDKSVLHLIQKFIAQMLHRIPDRGEDSEKAALWVGGMGNWGNTSGMLNQCKGHRDLCISCDEFELKPHLLNMKNGTFNLNTGQLQPHDPNDHMLCCCDFDYVEGQRCPVWEKTVDGIFGEDQELVTYVQTLLGYCISGTVEQEIFPVFYGHGCNGKSTVVQTLGKMLDSYSINLPSELFDAKKEVHPTYLAQLKGVRLAEIAELDSNVLLSESTVKKVTSQDRIEARRMREDPWMFEPSHTTLLCTNHKPKVRGNDLGIWRRLKLIPFTVDLSDVKDVTIPKRLEGEFSGIFNWIYEGYVRYKKGLLVDCTAVLAATQDYQYGEDDFAQFVEEYMEPEESAFLKVDDAFAAYQRQGGRLGKKTFCSEMARIGHDKTRVRINSVRIYGFKDLKLGGF